jgi:hypothetical protein
MRIGGPRRRATEGHRDQPSLEPPRVGRLGMGGPLTPMASRRKAWEGEAALQQRRCWAGLEEESAAAAADVRGCVAGEDGPVERREALLPV